MPQALAIRWAVKSVQVSKLCRCNREHPNYDVGGVRELLLHDVQLRNFGPFGVQDGDSDAVSYPISKRGMVLLKGNSNDGTGADSNGAGKVFVI